MAESISTTFSHMDLDTDATSVTTANTHLEATIEGLLERGRILHEEVEAYVTAVVEKQKTNGVHSPVEYRSLRNDMRNELSFLKKIADSTMNEEKARHHMVSSNLLYYEALWSAAKRSIALKSFRKYFFWGGTKKLSQTKGKKSTLVDIVAEGGTKWIRVSTLSEKRLLFDLAKLGWMNDSDEDEDEDEDMLDAPGNGWKGDEDDEDEVDIVKSARDLARAARANPLQGRPPKVHIVLTRLVTGKTAAIDTVIDKIRATGAVVECAKDIPRTVSLESVLPQLLLDQSRTLSDTLNIDCTILLALISDISHRPCPILDWYTGEVRVQIQEEAKEHLLPVHLYPTIASRQMVCTKEAADQMNLIVQTLATDAEKLRADILLSQNNYMGGSSTDLIAAWVATSDHAVPEGFALPIKVVSVDLGAITKSLPVVAATVVAELESPLNQSIFLYGWANDLTTLSANRTRERQIDAIINKHGLKEGEVGPHIWLSGEPRSLIAKQGRRK